MKKIEQFKDQIEESRSNLKQETGEYTKLTKDGIETIPVAPTLALSDDERKKKVYKKRLLLENKMIDFQKAEKLKNKLRKRIRLLAWLKKKQIEARECVLKSRHIHLKKIQSSQRLTKVQLLKKYIENMKVERNAKNLNMSGVISTLPGYGIAFAKAKGKLVFRKTTRQSIKDYQETSSVIFDKDSKKMSRDINRWITWFKKKVYEATFTVQECVLKPFQMRLKKEQPLRLTKEQLHIKYIKRMEDEISMGVHVSVYLIPNLNEERQKRNKVEWKAKFLHMSGVISTLPECGIVVVEGTSKQQKKFGQLMNQQFEWCENSNSCELIWKGKVLRRNFGFFCNVRIQNFSSEQGARNFFRYHHCEHLWNLASTHQTIEVVQAPPSAQE